MKSIFNFCLLVFLPASAQSVVTYSGLQDVLIPLSFNGVHLDLIDGSLHPGDVDFEESQLNVILGGAGMLTSDRFLPVRSGTDFNSPVVSLLPGELVTNTLLFSSPVNGSSQFHVGSGPEQFVSGVESFLGFQFDVQNDGVYHNGWMRVTFTDGTGPGVIHDWAYAETPGAPIRVGIIPEPTAAILGCVGMAVLLIRRKRS